MESAMAYWRITVLTIAVLIVPTPSFAQAAPDRAAKVAAARAFLKSSGAVDAMLAGMRANLPAQRQAMPQVPEEFWVRFESRMVKEAPALSDSIAFLYANTFSVSELQQLTTFFRSPIGRRLVEVQPHLIAESSAVGQRWGARLGEEIAKELMK
jgi:uncharacterized protein